MRANGKRRSLRLLAKGRSPVAHRPDPALMPQEGYCMGIQHLVAWGLAQWWSAEGRAPR